MWSWLVPSLTSEGDGEEDQLEDTAIQLTEDDGGTVDFVEQAVVSLNSQKVFPEIVPER
jgi:hypothetical protein